MGRQPDGGASQEYAKHVWPFIACCNEIDHRAPRRISNEPLRSTVHFSPQQNANHPIRDTTRFFFCSRSSISRLPRGSSSGWGGTLAAGGPFDRSVHTCHVTRSPLKSFKMEKRRLDGSRGHWPHVQWTRGVTEMSRAVKTINHAAACHDTISSRSTLNKHVATYQHSADFVN